MERIGWSEEHISSSKNFKETNDCTVLAWAHCFDCEYDKAHAWLKRFGRKNRHGMKVSEIQDALKACSRAKTKIGPYSRSNTITLNRFTKLHPKGRYYVLVRGHAICVKDGIVYDYKDGPRRIVHFACRVYLEGEI